MIEKCKYLRYLILDVDGTLTDGGIYYDNSGNELKKFCVSDAAGIFAIQRMKIKVIVITGRESSIVLRRLSDLKIKEVYQNIKNKKKFLKQYMNKNEILRSELAYIGDDVNDLFAMELAGFVACPNNACDEVKDISDYVSKHDGGKGAVRNIAEYMLGSKEEWFEAIKIIYQ